MNQLTLQYQNKQTPIHTHEHPNKTFLEFRTTYPIDLRWWDEICSRANDVIMAATKLMMPSIRLRIYDFDNNYLNIKLIVGTSKIECYFLDIQCIQEKHFHRCKRPCHQKRIRSNTNYPIEFWSFVIDLKI